MAKKPVSIKVRAIFGSIFLISALGIFLVLGMEVRRNLMYGDMLITLNVLGLGLAAAVLLFTVGMIMPPVWERIKANTKRYDNKDAVKHLSFKNELPKY